MLLPSISISAHEGRYAGMMVMVVLLALWAIRGRLMASIRDEACGRVSS